MSKEFYVYEFNSTVIECICNSNPINIKIFSCHLNKNVRVRRLQKEVLSKMQLVAALKSTQQTTTYYQENTTQTCNINAAEGMLHLPPEIPKQQPEATLGHT